MSTENTTVSTVDIDLDSIFNPEGSVLIPTSNDSENSKNSMFSRSKVDVSFLDKEPVTENTETDINQDPGADILSTTETSSEEIDAIINQEEEDPKTQSKSKLDKEGLVELANKLVEKKLIVPFEDDKPITDYGLKDFEELFEANFQESERRIRAEVRLELIESMPEEMQYAAKYLEDGGSDLKGLFRTLAVVEEVKSLDPSNEGDRRTIIRSYLQATNFGTPDEIEEEINGWDDRGELESKANKFKPKLDALTEKQVQYKLSQQELLREQQTKQAQTYMDNVYKTLEPAELNGLKLDKKTQNLLFSGLVQPNYESVSGRPTNLLGHLLEKYQFVEPNHSLVAEALWLLSDPDGYRSRVRENAKKEVVADTVRKLKGEQASRLASHSQEEDPSNTQQKVKGIPRPNQNFFKR